MKDKRRTILIVDDAEINRALMSTIFSDEYQVEEACDGIEALEKMRSLLHISAVILDLMMPRLDGYGVLKEMMQDDKLRGIPVIVVTGANDTDSQLKALDAGAIDVIVKPFNSLIMLHRVRNVVQRGEAVEEMEKAQLLEQRLIQSETDPKTGIFNKQTFCSRTTELITRHLADDYVLVLWDVDRFKMLNDRFGTDAGDRFLKYVGTQFQKLKSPDLVFGWIESDHFGLCTRMSVIQERQIADKMLSITDNGFEGFELISRLGIYEIEDPSMDVVLMIDRAMLALRSVKGNYEQRIGYYQESMRNQLVEEQEITDSMETALKTGQFKLYLQPQCNYVQKTIHGAEALVRWIHPTKGMIMPYRFIPLFERNGFITRMDAYMWEEACRLLRSWIDEGLVPVPISVNISRRDISAMEITETFVKLAEKYQIDRKLIHCEVTESAYIQEHDLLVDTVTNLQKEGFIVEMDDFGSGYSSLNFLKDVPVDMLKLDRKFLEGSAEDNRSGSILTSVIRMANWIQLPVIAEGVETKEQADYLKSVGCFYLQGYYYAKPMPAEEFKKFMQNIPVEQKYTGDYFSGVKGSEDYLSASTQATMLFNSFVGGAAIIEYDGTHVEALRLNDKFYDEIGSDPLEYAKLRMHIMERLEEGSKKIYLSAVQEAIQENHETSCITISKPLNKKQIQIYLHNSFRYLVGNAGRYILYVSVQNVTELMSLMNANKELVKLRTSIMNSVPSGIQTLNIRHNIAVIKYFNDRAASLFGFTRAEYEKKFGQNFTKAIKPEDIESIKKKYNIETLDQLPDLNVPIEVRHLTADGAWKWVRIRGSILQKEKNTVSITTIIEDIDASIKSEQLTRKQNEELEHQRLSLQMLYDTMPCGVMVFNGDPKGSEQLLSFNNMVWKLYRYSSRQEFLESIRSKSKEEGIYSADLDAVHQAVQQTVTTGMPAECDHRIMCADGSVRWIRSVYQNVTYADGSRITQALMTDITDHKQERIRTVAETLYNVYDQVYEVNVKDNTSTLRKASANSTVSAVGLTLPIQKQIERLLKQAADAEEEKRLHEYLDAGMSFENDRRSSLEYRIKAADGTVHDMQMDILAPEDALRLICISDVTKEKAAEDLDRKTFQSKAKAMAHQKENEYLRMFAETSNAVLLGYNPETDVMKLRGRSRDLKVTEYVREHFREELMDCDTINVEDRPKFMAAIREASGRVMRREFDCRMDVLGRGFAQYSIQVSSIADETGKIVRIIGLANETNTEQQLREQISDLTGVEYENTVFQDNFIREVLQILDFSASAADAMKLALAYTGEQYHLKRVYLVEENKEHTGAEAMYAWCAKGADEINFVLDSGEVQKARAQMVQHMDQHGNILVCENEQQMPGYVKKTLAHTDIKSAVLVGVREYELFHGFAVFDDSKERTWTPLQLNTLNVLVRLLSEFIKANRPQRRRDLPQKIRNEIADSSALVYVVDPDTCKVLYANKAICQEFGGASEGNTCYESFMNRQSMCDNCPLKAMRLTGAAIPVPIIREGRKYMMQASPFIWYGRKAVMITGTSANTFAMAANTIREIELNTTLNRYVFTLSAMFDQIFEIDYTKDTFRILIDKMNTTSDHSVQTDMTSVFELWKKHLDAEEQKSYEKFFNFHNIRAAFRSGKVPTMSCRIHFDDKDDAYISSTLLQLDSSRYLCCSNNITEQHRAVEMQQQLTALKARNEVSDKYRIVIDQIGLAVIDINHAANDMSVSEQFRAYAMNRDDFAKMLEEMREKKPVSSPHHAEMCLKLKMTDGSIHWVKAAGTYLYGQDGSLQRTVGTLRDINEKVIEHQELDRLRDRVNQVYAILPDGVCIYLVADQKKHLVFCSDRIWKMLGCTKEEADLTIANGTENRFMPDEIKIPEEQISQLKAGKPVVLQSIQLRRKDGMLFSVRAYCSMAESPDGNRYCYVILEELKDEKQIRFS